MSKLPPAKPEDLYDALERYYTDPEPDPHFAARLENGLRSKLIEQESQNMFGRKFHITPRLAWGLGLALVALVIGILAAPNVVAAMKRLLGYVPGVGMVELVEQGVPLRVLAEPVTQARDGITITVTDAVLSVDKSVIVYTVENIPFDKLSHREDVAACPWPATLRLPDGTQLGITGGGGSGWGSGYEDRNSYAAIPADVNEATLLIPCIRDVLPGVLPENWELPLRFVSAPADMTVMPVLEVTPAPLTGITDEPAPHGQNPISISNIIDTGDSFILIGNFSPPAPAEAEGWGTQTSGLTLTDAAGQEILYSYPDDINLPASADMRSEVWAVKIPKGFAAPLTIRYSATYILSEPQATYAFEFDAGPNPQPGQVWELKKEIQMAGHTFTLDRIIVLPGHNGSTGYNFEFTSQDGSVSGVGVSIEGYQSQGGGGGGGGGGSGGEPITFSAGLDFAEHPKGMLKIVLTGLSVYGETKEWSLEWAPDTSQSGFPSPTPAPQACLTLAAVQEALANPRPLPSDLTGKLIVYGRILEEGKDPSPGNYGVFVTSPDGSTKQVLGQGVWSALSPDGTKAAYAWDDGLYVTDLVSGQSYHVPGTNTNDYNPRWSPDGSRIAFVRIDDFNLYIINPDGSGLQKATDGIEYEQLIGWSADGGSLYYGIPVQDGHLLRQVDLASGVVQDLFNVISKGVSVAISPDGNWLASVERLADNPEFGLLLSRLDGSERRLLAQLDYWNLSEPVWSPDGEWLLFTATSFGQLDPEEIPVLLNLQTCDVFPLNFRGTVQGWSR
jgi:hypothetical protein